MNLAIFYGLTVVVVLVERSMSYSSYDYTTSPDNATDYLNDYGNPQYISDCSSDVIVSSYKAKILSSDSIRDTDYFTSQWTIIPAHPGGVVAISMLEYTIGADIFQNNCGDIELFQSVRNSTSAWEKDAWCRRDRLLPCVMTVQMAFYLGYVLTTAPGNGVEILYKTFPDMYEYGAYDKYFSLYYYECGGRRLEGEIRSPVFPIDQDMRSNSQSVSCKWQLDLTNSSDYGILRFSHFHLPYCDSHYLLIEEDTVFMEEDVSDELLDILASSGTSETDKDVDPGSFSSSGDGGSSDNRDRGDTKYSNFNQDVPNKPKFGFNSDVLTTQHYVTYFYRDKALGGGNLTQNRSGIHAVVITKYCGNYHPPRTKYWRRGTKNVTLTYVSQNTTSPKQGFEAKYSVFSWKNTMKDHRGRNINQKTTHTFAIEILLNYIGLIVFVPIGTAIGLSVIIYHIKTRGPTLRDFYKKEKRERKLLQRSNTERIKSNRPQMKHFPTRRTRSLDMPASPMARNTDVPTRGHGRAHRMGNSKFPTTILEEETLMTKSRSSGVECSKVENPLIV